MLLVPLAFLLLSYAALAHDGGGYDLSWWTVDGGGGSAKARSPSAYALDATIGQPDVRVWQGGGYTLAGGFWGSGVVQQQHRIYLPLVLRGIPLL
jgi:hypothetical protein